MRNLGAMPGAFDNVAETATLHKVMEMGFQAVAAVAKAIRCGRVVEVKPTGGKTACYLTEGGSILISRFLADHIAPGDEIDFPLTIDSPNAGTELYIRKKQSAGRSRDLYQTPVNYATHPKLDKRGQPYVLAELPAGRLSISSVHLPCEVLRDYFYVSDRHQPWERQPSLYDSLRTIPAVSLAELRLAFKLRQLELHAIGASKRDHGAVERAFNILAQPDLRACYDSLLKDPFAPVLFPYGGFGSIMVAGDRSRDGLTFFANRILLFLPEHRERRFRAPLRDFEFYDNRAIYQDARRKLEVVLDQSAMPMPWDATWNQWRHLLGAKIELQGTFVETGKFRHRRGEWQLIKWETALPSRIAVKVPANIAEQIETARTRYHRFGKFSDALAKIRARIEREPIERELLRSLCWDLGIPSDFDIAQINWQPGYDPFFYQQLSRRARQMYLFRDEYIFDLPVGIAVEKPQLGHATYLFSKPSNMEAFLADYIKSPKEDIRKNRGNIAEKLGFLGRTVHNSNPRLWLKKLESFLAEGGRS